MVGSKRKMVAFLLRAVEDVEYTFCFFEEMRNGVRNVSRIVNVLPNIILNCQSFSDIFILSRIIYCGNYKTIQNVPQTFSNGKQLFEFLSCTELLSICGSCLNVLQTCSLFLRLFFRLME